VNWRDILSLLGLLPTALRLLRSDDGRTLAAGIKELSDGDVPPPPEINATLVKAGVDTKQLAEAIHPVGPSPEGPGIGANV
jgi:hypothetical protein